jgi:hypothetical protein
MKKARYAKLNVTPEQIAAMAKTPKKLYDWTSAKPNWYWLAYVRNGKLIVERWPTNEEYVPQDDNPFWENEFHPDCRWVYDAVPGELRVFENRKSWFYTEFAEKFLKHTKASKLYNEIPEVYKWLKICNNGGKNVVNAELYALRKGRDTFETILRETDKFGSYWQTLPNDIDVLIVNYHNSGRGTDSISVHYRSMIRLEQSVDEITELVSKLS